MAEGDLRARQNCLASHSHQAIEIHRPQGVAVGHEVMDIWMDGAPMRIVVKDLEERGDDVIVRHHIDWIGSDGTVEASTENAAEIKKRRRLGPLVPSSDGANSRLAGMHSRSTLRAQDEPTGGIDFAERHASVRAGLCGNTRSSSQQADISRSDPLSSPPRKGEGAGRRLVDPRFSGPHRFAPVDLEVFLVDPAVRPLHPFAQADAGRPA